MNFFIEKQHARSSGRQSGIRIFIICLSMLLGAPATVAYSQESGTITGRVVDPEGNPVVGVNIYDRERSNIGTSTNGEDSLSFY